MFINKTSDGRNNICGRQIAHYRKASGKSQRELADALQLLGLDVDKNAVQRIEAGKRFVTDIALTYPAKVLMVSSTKLLDEKMCVLPKGRVYWHFFFIGTVKKLSTCPSP